MAKQSEDIAEEIVEELRMTKSVRNNKRQEIQMVASMIEDHTTARLQKAGKGGTFANR